MNILFQKAEGKLKELKRRLSSRAHPIWDEHSLLGFFFQIVVLITSLQIGYVVGGLVALISM